MRVAHDDCPVCVLYDRTAVAAALLEDAVPYAMAGGGPLPVGFGGTIALARRRVEEAMAQVFPASRIVPAEQQEALRVVANELAGAWSRGGAFLDPTSLTQLAALLRDCRQRAHAIAGAHFAASRGAAWTI